MDGDPSYRLGMEGEPKGCEVAAEDGGGDDGDAAPGGLSAHAHKRPRGSALRTPSPDGRGGRSNHGDGRGAPRGIPGRGGPLRFRIHDGSPPPRATTGANRTGTALVYNARGAHYPFARTQVLHQLGAHGHRVRADAAGGAPCAVSWRTRRRRRRRRRRSTAVCAASPPRQHMLRQRDAPVPRRRSLARRARGGLCEARRALGAPQRLRGRRRDPPPAPLARSAGDAVCADALPSLAAAALPPRAAGVAPRRPLYPAARAFKEALSRRRPARGVAQHDAHEFLIAAFDAIEAGQSRAQRRLPPPPAGAASAPPTAAATVDRAAQRTRRTRRTRPPGDETEMAEAAVACCRGGRWRRSHAGYGGSGDEAGGGAVERRYLLHRAARLVGAAAVVQTRERRSPHLDRSAAAGCHPGRRRRSVWGEHVGMMRTVSPRPLRRAARRRHGSAARVLPSRCDVWLPRGDHSAKN